MSETGYRIQNAQRKLPDDLQRSGTITPQQVQDEAQGPQPVLSDDGSDYQESR